MCGRFRLSVDKEELEQAFGIKAPPHYAPRYNIAPTQPVLAVRRSEGRSGREGVLLHWGLVPGWAKDPAIGNRLINARAETAHEKPAFRTAFRRRRCLVPADGFYEWAKAPAGKQPFHIGREDGRVFAFAGLWEHWMGPDGSEIDSCAILTTAANETMRPIHHRMPVVLAPGDYDVWLDRAEERRDGLAALLAPRPWPDFVAWPVSTYVNAPRNEGPRCAQPVTDGEGDDPQRSLL